MLSLLSSGFNSGNKSVTPPSSNAANLQPSEHLVKRGWLWKRAVGRSVIMGRKNWKLRFVESDSDSIRYYASEPFNDGALSCIYWSNVVHIYDKAPPGEEKRLEEAYNGRRMPCSKPPPPTTYDANQKGKGGNSPNRNSPLAANGNKNMMVARGGRSQSPPSPAADGFASSAGQHGHDEASYNTMTNNSYSFLTAIEDDPLLGDAGGGKSSRSSRRSAAAAVPFNNNSFAIGSSTDNHSFASSASSQHAGNQFLPTKNYFELCNNDPNFQATNAAREIYYFGVRFKQGDGLLGKGSERVLLFRTDCPDDHSSWVRYFKRVAELYSFTDDEDEDFESKSNGMMERVSRKLRTIVSLQKQRFTMGGFDLDLSYVLPNVIAMGFPCEGREELFRNPMSHVVRFFDVYHKRQFHVINLCSERFYSSSRFGGAFDRFPFDDHNPCPLPLLYDICECMYDHLVPKRIVTNDDDQLLGGPNSDKKDGDSAPAGSAASNVTVMEGMNPCATPKCVLESVYSLQNTSYPVVAVHCKAGKGRTGLAICAYLMYAGICNLPSDAMTLFAARRTKDGKGIQIPSQRRYLEYLHQSLHVHGGQIPSNVIKIRSVSINSCPKEGRGGGAASELYNYGGGGLGGEGEYYVRIEQRHPHHHRHVPMGQAEGNAKDPLVVIHDSSHDGHFSVKRLIEGGGGADQDQQAQRQGGGGLFASLLRKKPSNEELNIKLNATLRNVTDFRVALYSYGRQGGGGGGMGGGGSAHGGEAIYWCSVWLHTGFMPTGTHTIVFPKFEIDDAAKDKKHSRFPSNFQMTVEFSIEAPGPVRPAPKKPIPCLENML